MLKKTANRLLSLPENSSFSLLISTLFKRYWHVLLFLAYPLIVFVFMMTEQYIVPKHFIQSALDLRIPFYPVFVIPYLLWFPMIAFVLISLCLHNRADFIRTLSLLYLGMIVANVLFVLFPNGQTLRPVITDRNLFSQAVKHFVYSNDTNTNSFPSIHVLNQLAIFIGLCQSRKFKNNKKIKVFALICTILVCASTVFVKQHSILDVVMALLLEIPLFILIFKVNWRKFIPQKWQSKPVHSLNTYR